MPFSFFGRVLGTHPFIPLALRLLSQVILSSSLLADGPSVTAHARSKLPPHLESYPDTDYEDVEHFDDKNQPCFMWRIRGSSDSKVARGARTLFY